MKKQCCRRAFILGVLLFGAEFCDDTVTLYTECDAIAEICAAYIKEQFGRDTTPEKSGSKNTVFLQFKSKSAAGFLKKAVFSLDTSMFLKCEDCLPAFLRGAFVCGGTVSEPQKKDYHIEIKSKIKQNMSDMVEICNDAGFSFKLSSRLSAPSIYAKDSGTVGDFLFYIGANKQAFDFMNAKISHEIKNDINRRTNCETSNIARSTAATAKYLTAIKFLVEHGRLTELGPELEYTATMRLKHPEMSLVQLGQIMTPPVSKSGLYHRLEKIYTFSENIKNKEV